MNITRAALQKIALCFTFDGKEEGGILGESGGIVTRFYYDAEGARSEDSYVPDVSRLNAVLGRWAREKIRFAGLIHSHTGGCGELSESDKRYFLQIEKAVRSAPLYFPVICKEEGKILIYVHKLQEGRWFGEDRIVI